MSTRARDGQRYIDGTRGQGSSEGGTRVDDGSLTNGGDKPSGPRSRKGVETRARLVAAAKEIFEQDGFLDARISDIAERAGLSHGSFYHYFDSKEEVFREVALEVDESPDRAHEQRSCRPDVVRQPLRAHPRGHAAATSRATATRRASWA